MIATEFSPSQIAAWQRTLAELIRFESVFEHEHDIVAYVARCIEALGLRAEYVVHDPVRLRATPGAWPPFSDVPGRASLVTRVTGTGGGRSLVFNAPMDIVPAGDLASWTHPPFAAEIASNRIYGRGATDDKAGVAIALAVLELVAERKGELQGDVLFQFVLEDETGGNGTLLCVESGQVADAAVIIDGTRSDRAIVQHAGTARFGITLQGTPVSISVSHLGVNPAAALARLIDALSARFAALNTRNAAPWTSFPSPYQMVLHAYESIGTEFTIPEFAHADVYITFPPPSTLLEMRTFIETEAQKLAEEWRLPHQPAFTWDDFGVDPCTTPSEGLVAEMAQAAADCRMPAIAFGPSTGCSDMRHFARRGIPCVLYGPGAGYNPHRPDEYYELSDLPKMAAFFLRLCQRWCTTTSSTS